MKLYTKNNCSACENVKKYLIANQKTFDVVNIEEDYEAAKELVGAGFRSVPILLYDNEYLVGAAAIKGRV